MEALPTFPSAYHSTHMLQTNGPNSQPYASFPNHVPSLSPRPRRYLPVLRGFPAKYIYDPWNAPESVQKAAKCVIGVHYPKPMVHHAEASRLNIERMRQIYQQLSCYRGLGKPHPPE